eukprot:2289442-Amphidinium_carterae.1
MSSPSAPRALEEAVEHVKANAKVWHFSGMQDTQPWLFLDRIDDVQEFVQYQWYRHRDPSGIVAFAISEWCEALQNILATSPHPAITRAVQRLCAVGRNLRGGWRKCQICYYHPNHILDVSSQEEGIFKNRTWVCSECYMEELWRGAWNEQQGVENKETLECSTE